MLVKGDDDVDVHDVLVRREGEVKYRIEVYRHACSAMRIRGKVV